MTRNTYQNVADRYDYTVDEVKSLQRYMDQVWDYLAGDCIEFMDDPDDDETIVELITDAGRLQDHFRNDHNATVLINKLFKHIDDAPLGTNWAQEPRDIWNATR